VLHNTRLIPSTSHGRGELLPYVYFLEHHWFEKAVILHDSAFLQQKLDVSAIHDYSFLWTFEHSADDPVLERSHITHLRNNVAVSEFYENTSRWKGCFGAMAVVSHAYLKTVDARSDIRQLLKVITTRTDRMAFERIVACLLVMNSGGAPTQSLFGCIHKYGKWGKTMDDLTATDFDNPVVKVWTGR
jgi:hypothetical protein